MQLKKFLLFGLLAAVLPALAEEAADRKTATSLKYVEHELDTRQNKFTAEQNKAMEYTNTAGDVEKRTIKSDLGSSTSDTSLPMVGGVNTKLATKQDDIAPINDHTAVTYTGTSGKIGQKGIYQATESYVEQSDNLIDAKTFNAALKKGLDSEFLCSEYKPGTDLCWVWSIHNTEPVSVNLFDMSLITTNRWVVHNADGSITATGTPTSSAVATGKTLSQLAPELQVGKTYKFSINTTGGEQIYLDSPARAHWHNGASGIITQNMLNSVVFVYANGANTTATIYDIRIIDENPEMPFETLVPSDYTPVEYLQSDGTQYIDTGFHPKGNSRIMAKAKYNNVGDGISKLFGSRVGAGVKEFIFTASGSNGAIFSIGYGSHIIDANGVPSDTNIHIFDLNKGVAYVDNNIARNFTEENFTCEYPVYLFGANYAGTANGLSQSRFYYVKIYDDNVLSKNLIPCRRDSDSTLGMYDTVSGEFFENAGSGAFTAGPDISNIVYIPQNQ